ncbi:MAG: SBBP repeat-containing protein [Phycisphaerales bacterium]|nr:SBBP repeat-containing protein [Phycisphaerales bacterium]
MRQIRTAAAAMIALTVSVCSGSAVARQAPTAEVMSLGLRGVYFVENQGQWSDASVEYGFKTRGLDIAFRESSFTMHLSREVSRDVPVAVVVDPTDGAWASRPYEYQVVERASRPYESATVPEASLKHERGFFSFDDSHPLPHGRGSSGKSVEFEHLTLTVTFPGSNPATPRGAQPQAAKFNYYIGDDESKWASNVPSFGAIIYENLYDGVDLTIAGNDDGVLKYEFHVAPGADYSQIRIAYDGIDSLCVDESGDLRIATSFGTLMDSAPLVWQEDAALKGDVSDSREPGRAAPTSHDTMPARFKLVDEATYRFALDGPVDPARTLIIDPDVEWMVYIGGSGRESANDLALDRHANLLIVGDTDSDDLVGRNNERFGHDCAFVAKVSTQGTLLWSTYFGGESETTGAGIALMSDGVIAIAGGTRSYFLAGRINESFGRQDAFVAQFHPDGTLVASRYLGGIRDDWAEDITAGPTDEVYVVGETTSEDFEGAIHKWYGWNDAFVSRIERDGTLVWTRYLGGSRVDGATCVAIDDSFDLLIGGTTGSSDFFGHINEPPYGQSTFVAKVGTNGELAWVVFVGGWYLSFGYAIAADAEHNALLVGMTNAPNLPRQLNLTRGGYDGFLTKVAPDGAIQWSLYLGGRSNDYAYAVAPGSSGRVYVAGRTASSDFNFAQNDIHGNADAFITAVEGSGNGQWMMYVGGSDYDGALAMALRQREDIFIVGSTESRDFKGRTNTPFGVWDAYVARVTGPPILNVDPSCPSGGPIQVRWSGATPNGRAALYFARDTGSTRIAGGPCANIPLDLGPAQFGIALVSRSDRGGARTINTFAGGGICLGYLQLIDLPTCDRSNLVRIW